MIGRRGNGLAKQLEPRFPLGRASLIRKRTQKLGVRDQLSFNVRTHGKKRTCTRSCNMRKPDRRHENRLLLSTLDHDNDGDGGHDNDNDNDIDNDNDKDTLKQGLQPMSVTWPYGIE